MFCIEYGHKSLNENAIFCTNCGHPFSHNNEEKASIEKEAPVKTEKKRQRQGKRLLLIALIDRDKRYHVKEKDETMKLLKLIISIRKRKFVKQYACYITRRK